MNNHMINNFFIDILIFLTSFTVFIAISYLLTKMTFDSMHSDPQKQLNAAANFKKWGGWSSGMHKIFDKGLMKDVCIIMLIPLQHILKDKKSFYPIGIMGNIGHLISGLTLYYLVKITFGLETGLIIYFFYMFSIWPYMMIFHGSVHLIAQMFFLFSIILLFVNAENNINLAFFLYFMSGFTFALMNFSSASSRKYIPVYLMIFIHQLSDGSFIPWILTNEVISFSKPLMIIMISYVVILFIFFLISIIKIFKVKLLKIFNKDLNKKNFEKLNFLINEIWRFIFFFSFLFIVILIYIQDTYSYIKLFFFIVGFLIVIIYLLLPNFVNNIKLYYFVYIGESQRFNKNSTKKFTDNTKFFINNFKYKKFRSHLDFYEEYFKKFYSKIYRIGSEDFLTYLKLYFRIIPFHTIIFFLSFLMLFYEIFNFNNFELKHFIYISFISFIPIILNKITFGPVALLPFYSTYIVIFIPITVAVSFFIHSYEFIDYKIYLYLFLLLFFFWNLYIFFTDILPSKTSINKIIQTINNKKITKIHTYKNKLMEAPFIDLIKYHFGEKIKIIYINSISELNDGFVFIPVISAKSWYYESDPKGPSNNYEDFKDDKKLYKLIETKKIDKMAIGKYKTMGTSSFWSITTHIPAFRDLKLNEINNDVRYFSHTWILDVKDL